MVTLSPRSSSQSVSYRKALGSHNEAPCLLPSILRTLTRTFLLLDMQPDPISAEKQRKQAAMRRNRLRKMKVSGFDDELFV